MQIHYCGTGNLKNQFWGTGEQANLFQGNKGIGAPHPDPDQSATEMAG